MRTPSFSKKVGDCMKFNVGDYVLCVKPKSEVGTWYDLTDGGIYIVEETIGIDHDGIKVRGSSMWYRADRFIKYDSPIEDDVGVDFF